MNADTSGTDPAGTTRKAGMPSDDLLRALYGEKPELAVGSRYIPRIRATLDEAVAAAEQRGAATERERIIGWLIDNEYPSIAAMLDADGDG